MALKELWGRLTGRPAAEDEPPATPPPPPADPLPPGPPDAPSAQPDHLLPPVAPMPGVILPSAPSGLPTPDAGDLPAHLIPPPGVPFPSPAPPLPDPPSIPASEPLDPDEPRAPTGFLTRLKRGLSPAFPVPDAGRPSEAAGEEAPSRGGFLSRLRAGLSRSTAKLTENITSLFRKRRLDDEALEELEDTLITADLGVGPSRRIVESFRRTRFGKEVTDDEVKAALAEEIADILAPVAVPLTPPAGIAPWVVLVVGVNGTGKTTTIAKLARIWRDEGRSVMLAAGDTFRAAAVEQLQVWADRTGSAIVLPAKEGADAAGLVHDALTRARAEGADILLVDTAGRLHNKAGLMDELRKVVRVLRRLDPAVPHATLLVLDATTGQNAVQQCKVFREMVDVTGLIVTKLDGSAKGGVVVALAGEFGLPVHAVGVGESAADLRPFDARDFARSLVGLDD